MNGEPFSSDPGVIPAVRGFLHRPAGSPAGGLVLAHGAGSNCHAPLLVAVADALADAGLTVLRCDLPFRQARPHGPPVGTSSALDRDGLRNAALALQKLAPGRVFLGGHSYGGRQASMLAAAEPTVVEGLLLLAYPLHPPRRPTELRTAHFSKLSTAALFVHGSRDPFGSLDEMRDALALIPSRTALIEVPRGGHDLSPASKAPLQVVQAFLAFFGFTAP